jgi:hypothetical protein
VCVCVRVCARARSGLIDPRAYRMCFPLRLTRWVHTTLLRRRFLVFDACAQYLTAPWVPHLLRRATPRAKLIVCVRDPVLQNLSWWRYGPSLRSANDKVG